MATTKADASKPTNNAGGVMALVSTGAELTGLGYSSFNSEYEARNTKTSYRTTALAAGKFGRVIEGKYVFWGHTDSLAGVSKSNLNVWGNLVPDKYPYFDESGEEQDVTAIDYNWQKTYGVNAGNTYNYKSIDGGSTIDKVAHLTRSDQGTFTIHLGVARKKLNYEPKNQ